VGRRDKPHVNANIRLSAHSADDALLQHAEEHWLLVHRQLADLVQEERRAAGELEQTGAIRSRRIRARDRTKQLGGEDVAG
jgi:hypothetical protein